MTVELDDINVRIELDNLPDLNFAFNLKMGALVYKPKTVEI